MTLLKGDFLSFSYPGRGGPLLENLSLELGQGEILTLLGPSGCGKTTLLKLLSGFLRPDRGELRYRGSALKSPFPEGQMIFQDSAQLLPWLNVEDNILFPVQGGCRGRRGRKDALRFRLDEVLRSVGLSDFAHYHPARLSGGMKQRCALGRALMAEPEILFLDEPFGSLDAPSRGELQGLLLSLWKKKGFSMIFVTHDIAEALLLSDRILLFGGSGGPGSGGTGRGGTAKGTSVPRLRDIDLPRPRNRQSDSFRSLELELYSALSDGLRTL